MCVCVCENVCVSVCLCVLCCVVCCVCVCAEWQITLPPSTFFHRSRGLEPARGVSSQRRRPPVSGSKRTCGAAPGPLSWQLAGPPQTKVPFWPFSPKPAEPQLYSRLTSCTRTMRDLSVVLETHQLYSRLISCTRKISTLHLEFKCVHPIRGESSGVPIV